MIFYLDNFFLFVVLVEQTQRFLWKVFVNIYPTQQIQVNLHSDWKERRKDSVDPDLRGQKLFSVNCDFFLPAKCVEDLKLSLFCL